MKTYYYTTNNDDHKEVHEFEADFCYDLRFRAHVSDLAEEAARDYADNYDEHCNVIRLSKTPDCSEYVEATLTHEVSIHALATKLL